MSNATSLRNRWCLLFVSLLLATVAVSAQAVDRAKLLQEIIELNSRIKATTDPAAVKELTAQVLPKESLFLAPAPEDLAQFSTFLQQPYTGIVRLMPREQFDGVLLTRGGGSYYSFASLVHQYGYGSDLNFSVNNFLVGFAGADFGMILTLGSAAVETVTTDTPGIKYLATYTPPLDQASANAEYQRVRGFSEGGFNYASRLTATLGQTYVVRSIGYRAADVLVAFRPFRRDTDGSLLLQWKLLKRYPSPNLNGGVIANVSAASFAHTSFAPGSIVSLFGKELTDGVYSVETTALPQSFGQTRVNVQDNSLNRRSGLFAGTPDQINFLIPPETAEGYGLIFVTTPSGNLYGELVNITKVAPGLFSANANGSGVAAAVALRVNGNRQTYEPVARFDNALKQFVATPIDLGTDNEQVVLLLFGTGVRGRTALETVNAKVGGVDAPVLYAGEQGAPGLDQINVLLPRALAGRGEVEIVLTVDGKTANAVRLNIK
ncbi:MAG: hypothetical protein HYR56_14830 [Acidobacteria bacterium]|nr:hypothetical protein [Acidobacteriota bacterium]MBI3427957.1 hypothetical protein [Acidobacteriota bacterium]